ncbi:substrate-binding periplasmic protein [Sediminispirochaeta bajacaliforniensis]|uniref:substrate-binding periplasmic protein n=1 Tax=Sediminispirochaeta bajacaliforniensis TaxID=148 RepID=UPI000360B026|nr:ABC transporter substrate-binding protein [Sediminispirochaeta bajacaliforniensis]
MKKKNAIIFCLFALALGFFLTGCSQSASKTVATGGSAMAAGGTQDAMDQIFADGKLVVATELGTPPFAYKDPKTGEIDGLAIELARMFADELGVELEIRTFEWAGIIPSLLTGQVDMLTTCLTRTTARAGKMIFIEPFVAVPAHALVRKGTFHSLSELNNPDVVLTTTTGGIYEELAEKLFPNAQIKTNGTNADNAVALQTMRADAYLNDKLQLVASMEMYKDQFELIPEPIAWDSLAFATRFDSPKLANSANMFMRLIKMNGKYAEIFKKWMGYDYVPTFEVGS